MRPDLLESNGTTGNEPARPIDRDNPRADIRIERRKK